MTTRRLFVIALPIVGSLLCVAILWRIPGQIAEPLLPPFRLTRGIPSTLGGRELGTFAISPDGTRIAYTAEENGRSYLFIMSLGPPNDTWFGASAGAQNPFFSPDGRWIAFFANRQLSKIRVDEEPEAMGRVVPICEAPSGSAGGTWTDDNRIVFAPLGGQGLLEVPATGGTPTPLTRLDSDNGELAHGWPHALPDGKGIVLTVSRKKHDPWVAVLPPNSSKPRLLLPAMGQAQFVSTGHLVYGYLGSLMAAPFDVTTLQTQSGPTPIAKGLQSFRGFGDVGRTAFSVSRRGSLVWLRGNSEDPPRILVWVDRAGRLVSGAAIAAHASQTSFVSELAQQYQSPRLSPDGRRIAVAVQSGLMTREIRVIDVTQPERVVETFSGGDTHSPAWMSDSRRLTFASNRDGVQRMYAAGVQSGGLPQPLLDGGTQTAGNPVSWARQVPLLAFYEIDGNGGRDVWFFRPGAGATPVIATAANERSPALSFDGRWLAYVSDETGRDEVYAQRINPQGDKTQVSAQGGVEPVWTRDGLIYRNDDAVMLAPFGNRSPGLSAPHQLFERRFELDPGANLPAYDVSRDGQRLLMLKRVSQPRELRFVWNWSTELAQTVPTKP